MSRLTPEQEADAVRALGYMKVAVVRSVLGDWRQAEVRFPDSDHPWFECPFGYHATYVREPAPGHASITMVGRHGVCRDPWCIANPDMPLDRAREIRAAEMMKEDEDRARARNIRIARERIAEDRLREAEGRRQRAEEARSLGKCVVCAVRDGKLVKHRKPCPHGIPNGGLD